MSPARIDVPARRGRSRSRLLQERVTGPLGIRNTANAFTAAIPAPVLHSFDAERGKYEEPTFWNPSWTTARGAVLTTNVCDLAGSARAIGAGELTSPRGLRTQLNPGTVGLGTATSSCPASVCFAQKPDRHFGLGVVVQNGWVTQTPSFAGYAAIQAYLPAERPPSPSPSPSPSPPPSARTRPRGTRPRPSPSGSRPPSPPRTPW